MAPRRPWRLGSPLSLRGHSAGRSWYRTPSRRLPVTIVLPKLPSPSWMQWRRASSRNKGRDEETGNPSRVVLSNGAIPFVSAMLDLSWFLLWEGFLLSNYPLQLKSNLLCQKCCKIIGHLRSFDQRVKSNFRTYIIPHLDSRSRKYSRLIIYLDMIEKKLAYI